MPLFGPPNIRKMRTKGDIEGLVKALSYQKDEKIRKAAWTALGELGDKKAVDPIIPFLNDASTSTRDLAVQTLVQMGETSVGPLILHLNDPDQQKMIARILTKIGPPAVEPLIRCLAAEDQEISHTAAKILGQIRDPRAIEPLIACLGSDSIDRSRAAISALGNIADLRSIMPLINVLNDTKLRSTSKKVLQKIGKPAIEPLVAVFETGSENIRKTVLETLAVIRGPRAYEVLNLALKDKSEVVKKAASRELAHIDRIVARNTVILENIWSKPRDRQNTIHSLIEVGQAAIKSLLPLLKKREIMTREAAIQILSNFPDDLTEEQKEILDQATTKLNQDTREIKRQIKPLEAFLGSPYPPRDKIHKIGQHIYDVGGHSGMWLAFDPIRSNIAVGPHRYMLDKLWDRIGTWLA